MAPSPCIRCTCARPFAAFPEVVQYQLIHEQDRLVVQIVVRERSPADTPERLRDALLRGLGNAGAVPPPVIVNAVSGIYREPGAAGKFN